VSAGSGARASPIASPRPVYAAPRMSRSEDGSAGDVDDRAHGHLRHQPELDGSLVLVIG
jgi:hypothetical protein